VSALRTVWSWLDVMHDGHFVYEATLPQKSAPPKLFGVPVQHKNGVRWVEVPIPVAPPASGFPRTADEISEAVARRDGRRPQKRGGGHDKTMVKPLAGLGVWDGVDPASGEPAQFRLMSDRADYYTFRMRAPQAAGWKNRDGQVLAHLSAEVVHRRLAAAVKAALSSDVGVVRLPSLQVMEAPPEEGPTADMLRSQADRFRRLASAARSLAVEAVSNDDKEAATEYERTARSHSELAKKLDDQADAVGKEEDPQTAEMSAEVWDLAHVTELLSRGVVSLPRRVNSALRDLIGSSLRVEVDGFLLATLTFTLRLPTESGVVEVGPVSFRVPNSRQLAGGARNATREARSEAFTELYCQGWSIEQLAAEFDADFNGMRARISRWVGDRIPRLSKRKMFVRKASLDCRRALWAHWTGGEVPADLDPGVAAQYVHQFSDPSADWGPLGRPAG